MPRPIKWRRVGFVPEVTYFKPAGIPVRAIEEVSLSVEELEAIRLKDQEGLQQEECAELMQISRPTFHRVLSSARSKVADALTSGKAIRVEGGNFEMARHRFRCGWDGHEWDVPSEETIAATPTMCPRCKRSDVQSVHHSANDSSDRDQKKGGGRGWRDKNWQR